MGEGERWSSQTGRQADMSGMYYAVCNGGNVAACKERRALSAKLLFPVVQREAMSLALAGITQQHLCRAVVAYELLHLNQAHHHPHPLHSAFKIAPAVAFFPFLLLSLTFSRWLYASSSSSPPLPNYQHYPRRFHQPPDPSPPPAATVIIFTSASSSLFTSTAENKLRHSHSYAPGPLFHPVRAPP